jgi:hypothetical protein
LNEELQFGANPRDPSTPSCRYLSLGIGEERKGERKIFKREFTLRPTFIDLIMVVEAAKSDFLHLRNAIIRESPTILPFSGVGEKLI